MARAPDQATDDLSEHRYQTVVAAWIERNDKERPPDPDLAGGVTELVERSHPAPMP